MSKVIKVELSVSSINKAIKDLEMYQAELKSKVGELRRRLAEEIAAEAQISFNSAKVSDIIKGGTSRNAEVTVSVADSGDVTVVVADGEDAVWCEFGSGVYHNGSVGSSPNPLGANLGFTIGSYGKGRGKQTAWGYYSEDNEVVITRGTPATMPMYTAAVSVMNRAVKIAREVFG